MTTPLEAAFRVAVLDALAKRVGKALIEARKEAEPLFARHRIAGNPQVEVALPSGAQVGTVSIKAGTDGVRLDETALMAYVVDHAPTEIETTLNPAALDRPDVAAYVRRFYPDLVTKRVREAFKTKVLAQLNDDGELVIEGTGEVVKLAERVNGEPTGAFALTFVTAKKGKPNGRDQIAAAWSSGELSLADLVLPAIEPGGDQ
jgi:hypothetical protein